MCYTRKDRGIEREDPMVIQVRRLEEEARLRQEEHERRRAKEEDKSLTEKLKEVVSLR